MNIKFKNNLTYYIIFNIHEEKKLQKYLFSLDNGIGWGNWLGKEIDLYYSNLKKQVGGRSSKYVGIYTKRKRVILERKITYTRRSIKRF